MEDQEKGPIDYIVICAAHSTTASYFNVNAQYLFMFLLASSVPPSAKHGCLATLARAAASAPAERRIR